MRAVRDEGVLRVHALHWDVTLALERAVRRELGDLAARLGPEVAGL